MKYLFLILSIAHLTGAMAQRELLRVEEGLVSFISDAPLETIQAENSKVTGLLDRAARTFAVQVLVVGFEGFNTPLQQEHFNENYLVSKTWPKATFQGRIIETVDLTKPGTYAVRAKGMLTIRGQAIERIVACRVVVQEQGLHISSIFEVVLDDHGIRIPRVVQQKIAATVKVVLELQFAPEAK